MKLKNLKGEVFDCPSSTGRALIAAGFATEVLPEPPAKSPVADMTWVVVKEPITANDGFHVHRGFLRAYCSGCGVTAMFTGPTVHKHLNWRHCGIVVQEAPPNIQREYAAFLDEPDRRAAKKAERQQARNQQLQPLSNW